MARNNQDFQTIRSEGGLLPPDLLRRMLDPKERLEGTLPTDYGLAPGERLNEVITQSWNRLRKHWVDFRAAAKSLPADEAGTGLTNDKWSIPLLRELDFGMLPTTQALEINGKTYAITRFFGSTAVHLIGCGLDLDRRAKGMRGAAIANPHGLVQDFLNRSDKHLWAILSNGRCLRILRDSQAISRQSFLEFDLEAMFDGEVFADFVLLWLVAHSTRFAAREADRPESCWLERWTKVAEEQGTRALGDLKQGVEKALEVLGQGLVGHPKNTALRDALRSGQLSLTDFHGQLLRVVYRLIFLFVAEDRTLDGLPLLHPRDSSESARTVRDRYHEHYSAGRLRELAGSIRGSRHGDLWQQFNLIIGALSGEDKFKAVRQALALPALGSFLWSPSSTAALNAPSLAETDGSELANADFLDAIRNLAFTRPDRVLRPVDYKNLGAEELGGVYESLLALTPQISGDGARFTFAEFAGNERKTSGSYYTPDSLVQCLLDSALEPVIEEAVKGKTGPDAERAILDLKVCDPAVGSGHFLVGAAHRLARHLARIRAVAQGEGEPSPQFYQHALRDVIGRCLYGVDINPMAAELCRVSLWLEALEPGKPLSFLDHHIRVGNSLLGTTPELIAGGLPDDAFIAIEGDDKRVCAQLKRRNKAEREGFEQKDWIGGGLEQGIAADLSAVTREASKLDATIDDTVEAVKRKEDQYRRLVVSPEFKHAQQIADTWCAAFVWNKTTETEVVTSGAIRRLGNDEKALSPSQIHEVERLTGQYQFFHWPLAFPQVFDTGGFSCVLGNPPWERIKPEPAKYFALTRPDIADAQTASVRDALIANLSGEDPIAFSTWKRHERQVLATHDFLVRCGRFRLSATGKFNIGNTFVDLGRQLLAPSGLSGLLNVSGLATDDSGSAFIADLMESGTLVSFYDFENRMNLFPAVHSSYKFSAVTIGGKARARSGAADFVFYAQGIDELRDAERHVHFTAQDIELLNPSSRNCPVFRNAHQAEAVKAIYRRARLRRPPADVLWQWDAEPTFLFVMSDHSDLFGTREKLGFDPDTVDNLCPTVGGEAWVPLYESKMLHQFDHRWASLSTAGDQLALALDQKQDPYALAVPRYWMRATDAAVKLDPLDDHKWLVTVREVTNATNERTCIAAIAPRYPVGHNAQVFRFREPAADAAGFLGILNSVCLDFAARTKIGGSHLSSFILKQLPILAAAQLQEACRWTKDGTTLEWLSPRVLELTYTAWDLAPFAKDCGFDGAPFQWDENRRSLIRAELDAAFFHLYLQADRNGEWVAARKADGCLHDETPEQLEELRTSFPKPRDAVDYIMDTFPIVKRKDEEKYGSYRTKETILSIYDEMQDSIRTGGEYRTKLSPEPGSRKCCHSPRSEKRRT